MNGEALLNREKLSVIKRHRPKVVEQSAFYTNRFVHKAVGSGVR